MPGKMDDNLRRGNSTEDLGINLLQGFAAVAPVPRTQDVGIDAIATLLRRMDGRQLIAEDSIFVQLKASSVRKISYDETAIDWLEELQLPFFIGSVDAKRSEMSLFSIHHLTQLFDSDNPLGQVELYLDLEDWHARNLEGFGVRVYIGPPILKWSTVQCAAPEFLDSAYSVMCQWSHVEKTNIILRKMGRSIICRCKTGEPPTHDSYTSGPAHGDNSLQSAIDLLGPALSRVAAETLRTPDTELLRDIAGIASRLERYGFDSGEITGMAIAAKLRSQCQST